MLGGGGGRGRGGASAGSLDDGVMKDKKTPVTFHPDPVFVCLFFLTPSVV